MDFYTELLRRITDSLPNDYTDNWDELRFGKEPHKKVSLKESVKSTIRKRLFQSGYYNLKLLSSFAPSLTYFNTLYNMLEFDSDKSLLVALCAYRMLGYKKVKLPVNNSEYWTNLEKVKAVVDKRDLLKTDIETHPMYKSDLTSLGYPIKLYYNETGINLAFMLRQYEYNKNGIVIKAKKGDVVIDAGSWVGDTALFFANEIGEAGKVYTFDFIPNNMRLLAKSLALNPELSKRIEVIERPLWSDSNTKIYYTDKGSGSYVSMTKGPEDEGECVTLSIDDLVSERSLDRIDYIKMNIGSAEMAALTGATKTIKRFRPILAITIFHTIEEYGKIPQLIKEILPDYKFYLTHGKIQHEETLLIASVQ